MILTVVNSEAKPQVSIGVVTAAGQGTRMWPATKVFPKELLPLGKIPILVYVIWELVDAGISEIVVVAGEHNADAIERFLDSSAKAPANVASDPEVKRFTETLERVKFTIIQQKGPYGNATPLVNARELIGDRPCIYAFADDVVIGENASAALISVYEKTGYPVLCCQAVPEEKKSKFGIVECFERNGLQYVNRIVEKPRPGATTSNLAAFGRYLVTPELLRKLDEISVGANGELWFTDTVAARLRDHDPVCVWPLAVGAWYTVGDPVGFAKANAAISLGSEQPAAPTQPEDQLAQLKI
jgi:UTP--glucose-1-phosphate uridylyltransferase